MGKKCIPGVICIENMTLFLLFVILVLVVYFYYSFSKAQAKMNNYGQGQGHDPDSRPIIVVNQPPVNTLGAISTRLDPFNDPYSPPMKSDNLGIYYPRDFGGDIRGVPMIPVNIESRGLSTGYQQVGILTRLNSSTDMILPLMGRRNMAGRDKWQYYTMSNTGNISTKLPVSQNGKSCTSEYGCDSINNGDMVYVEGYNDSFKATVYETSTFRYLPQL